MEREAEGAAQDAQPPRDAGGGRGAAGGEWPEPATRDAAGGIWPVPADGGDRQLARGGTLARDAQPAPAACDADDGARPAARDARAAARDARRDARWVRAVCRRGSRTAAEKLVHAYYDEIYVFAYRQTGCKEDALDLTQGIFMAVNTRSSVFPRSTAGRRRFARGCTGWPPTRPSTPAAARVPPPCRSTAWRCPPRETSRRRCATGFSWNRWRRSSPRSTPACRPCSGCTCSPRRASRNRRDAGAERVGGEVAVLPAGEEAERGVRCA